LALNPKDTAGAATTSPFQRIYDRDVFIYRFSGALPRAALYSAAEVLPESDVLARLKTPDFDPEQTVILGSESIPAENKSAVQSFVGGAASPVRAAQITKYGPTHVQIETKTAEPAILTLNDTDYPGWRATINGMRTPVMRANYLFRGVVVPAGRSVVDFYYEPQSFRIGAYISGVSLIVKVVVPLATRRRRNCVAATDQGSVLAGRRVDPGA
jgi:hypothetical protein